MPNIYDLAGKTAIVTGGGKGIGQAIARHLAASGARVRVWDAHPGVLQGVSAEAVDVTDPGQISDASARNSGERIDILVNNAGYLGTLHPFGQHEPRDWLRIIQVNLIGMMNVTQAVLPHMRSAGGGRIVKLGSLAGKEGLVHLAAYSAASAGVIAFTKALGRVSSSGQHFWQLRRAWTH